MRPLSVCPEGYITPAAYLEATPEMIADVCNGCGPAGVKIDLVPDALLGLDVTGPCNRHDWMYHDGQDRALADAVFIANRPWRCAGRANC